MIRGSPDFEVCPFYPSIPITPASCDLRRTRPRPVRFSPAFSPKHRFFRLSLACLQNDVFCSSFVFLAPPKSSDEKDSNQTTAVAPAHVRTRIPAGGGVSVGARHGSRGPRRIHIKTQQPRQLPVAIFRFCRDAFVAVSNTSQIPSLVLAEHSR